MGLGLASLVSFGLLIPWATIVERKFLLKHTEVHLTAPLDNVIADNKPAGGAAAAEYSSMEGVTDGVFDAL